jgi:hypothetical protein
VLFRPGLLLQRLARSGDRHGGCPAAHWVARPRRCRPNARASVVQSQPAVRVAQCFIGPAVLGSSSSDLLMTDYTGKEYAAGYRGGSEVATAGDSERLPRSSIVWLIVRILLTAVGGIVIALPEQVSQLLHDIPLAAPRNFLDQHIMNDPKPYMVITGTLFILAGTVASFRQERAAARAARDTWKNTVFFLDELRRGAGPQIRRILESQTPERRREELGQLQKLVLAAASKKWTGKGEDAAPHFGYYLAENADRAYKLQCERFFPADSNWEVAVTSYPAPLEYRLRKKLEPSKHPEAMMGSLREAVLQVPVKSPLETSPVPLGVVIVDAPNGSVFEGRASEINAEFMAGWLAAGQLIAGFQ